jgi:hypothetical protein
MFAEEIVNLADIDGAHEKAGVPLLRFSQRRCSDVTGRRKIESSRLQVVWARPSARRFRRYSLSFSVVSGEVLRCPKKGRMFALMHHSKIRVVDTL